MIFLAPRDALILKNANFDSVFRILGVWGPVN